MTALTEILGTKYPLVQGSMARISNHVLVIAVSKAGGLGVLTSVGLDQTGLRTEIKKVKAATDQPFAVNLMLMMDNIADLVEVIIEEEVPIVMTGAGTPKPYMPMLLAAGVKVIPVIPSVKLAQKMEALGAVVVVAEGMESGGHIGATTTMALVPQVVSAVHIPVIAAGGIGDGRGVAAALALGAQGGQIGTLFLTADETPIADAYKAAIIDANDTATTVTGRQAGAPVRALKNTMTNKYLELEAQGATWAELETVVLHSLAKAAFEGDLENGSIMAGEIVGLIQTRRPVQKIIEDLFHETEMVIKHLNNFKLNF
ncbi:enoyl-[acyl-carrier-protein] reductase FabK [Weissella coleopterorum]|uniref:Probable nitronate monooxygenase n=1 Tax=Weissella coleopterorum TaxID=2714949 RepID=A0A6G8AZC4_9LACO|nr:nitronate monooxygenase [Weissella coleopterorum]QIL50337.1 enoyl-[acyl-carrier-protein] reductase FabK [Weissella coleopterorum]